MITTDGDGPSETSPRYSRDASDLPSIRTANPWIRNTVANAIERRKWPRPYSGPPSTMNKIHGRFIDPTARFESQIPFNRWDIRREVSWQIQLRPKNMEPAALSRGWAFALMPDQKAAHLRVWPLRH